jgi:outer membrane protein OmpA-like peptidoglycan-associated protein
MTTKQANIINGSLEGEIKDLVFKVLSGENLLKKVYYGSVAIAKIPKKIIQDKVKKAEIKKIVAEIQRVNIVDFDIAFEGNHWKLKDSAKNELNKLGAVLSSDVLNNGVFELVGHVAGKGGMHKVCIDSQHKVVNNSRFAMECWDTDNAWAQTLSERRAQSVRDYLLKNFTIPAGRIKAYGVGHSQHKFNNPDDAGNRRVEVKYIKQ